MRSELKEVTDGYSPPATGWQTVKCACGWRLSDGSVLKARVLELLPDGAVNAKCTKCRRWSRVDFVR